jgi:hypothetical protein
MRRTGLVVVVTLLALAFTPTAVGGTNPQTGDSTAKTPEAPLNNGKGVPDVRYACTETLTAKSDISVECDFINKSKTKGKRFIVCMMLDLKKGKQKPVPNIKAKDKHDYELRPDEKDPKKLKCVEVNGSDGSDTSYHFGCQLITLKPGETKKVTFKGKSPYEAPPKMKVTANDFWINYADTVNLDSKQDTVLDEKSCEAIIGQGQFLTPKVEGLSANWVAKEVSFKDPVLGIQRTTVSAVSNLIYERLDVVPCAPPAVPASTPPEGKCPGPSSRPPPPTKLDLNLYWFDSISSPHESYRAVLRVRIGGYSRGIRLVTSPAAGTPFMIPGGRRLYGSIVACATTPKNVCIPPAVPEGTRTTFEVDVLDAKTHGTLFSQFGTFIQDTHPPHVDSVVLTRAAGHAFAVYVRATDATTSPLAATLWYSTNHGATWQPAGLRPTSELLNSSRSRSFTGTFAPAAGAPATYYIVVADELDNEAWFGPGTTEPTATPPPKPSLTPIHAVFTPAPAGQSCEPPYCTTVYTENATGQGLTYSWTVSIPDDPGCAMGFHPSTPQPNLATWYHADVSEGGYCNHSGNDYDATGSGHPGTVTVTVTNAGWTCTATFHGTQGPQAQPTWDGPAPQPCQPKQ